MNIISKFLYTLYSDQKFHITFPGRNSERTVPDHSISNVEPIHGTPILGLRERVPQTEVHFD